MTTPALTVASVTVCSEGHGIVPAGFTICPQCFSDEMKRIEEESLPLRLANTSEALRARVLTTLGETA